MKIKYRSIAPCFQIAIFLVSIGLLNAYNFANPKFKPNLAVSPIDRSPSKKIRSKQAIGRLRSLFWGDYFYAIIKTKTENITFTIDGIEDCLLKQNKDKIMTIEYDEIERYIPQLNGYRKVNIIKQIDRVDVAHWQKSLTRSQVKKCQIAQKLSGANR